MGLSWWDEAGWATPGGKGRDIWLALLLIGVREFNLGQAGVGGGARKGGGCGAVRLAGWPYPTL